MNKKVVILAHLRVFPVVSGGSLRTRFIASSFSKRGYDVTIVSLADKRIMDNFSPTPPAPIREVVLSSKLFTFAMRVGCRLSLPALWYEPKVRLLNERLHRDYLADADIVVADLPYLYRVFENYRGKKILNTHNVEHHLYTGFPGLSSWVRSVENKAHAAAEMTLCCTPEDAAYFENLGGKSKVSLVPNGIDVTPYKESREERDATRRELGLSPDDIVVLFPASSYRPNVDGAQFLLSFVNRYRDRLSALKVKIAIVGSVLPVKTYNNVLQAYGKVPKIAPFFAAADIAVNPIFSGSGSSLKVAEFIAAGLPLMTTKTGARGFDLDDQSTRFFSDEQTLMTSLEYLVERRKQWKNFSDKAWDRNAAFITGDKAFDEMLEALFVD